MRFLFPILVFALLVRGAVADPIPSDRKTDWTRVGIPGGIPTNYTLFCNVRTSIPGSGLLAVGDGVTDDTAALQAAINLAPLESIVYLPAGTYLTTAALNVTGGKVLILRGDGPSSHIRNNAESADAIKVYQPTWNAAAGSNIVSGATLGSIEMVTGAAVTLNDWYFIGSETDPADVIRDGCSTDGEYFHNFRQIVQITNVSGTTSRFTPPLRWELSTKTPWVHVASAQQFPSACGIESLSITFAQAGSPIRSLIAFVKVQNCWVTSCVLSNTVNNAIKLEFASHCEVKSNVIHHAWDYVGGRGYGVWEFDCAGDNLIENNIFHNLRHSYASEGWVTGSVIAYNYETNELFRTVVDTPANSMSGSYITHGVGAKFNLFESNMGDSFSMDNVHASGLRNTIFRNRVLPVTHNDDFPDGSITYGTIGINVGLHNNYINIVGNVIGISGVTVNYEGNTTNAPGYAQYVYMLGFSCGNVSTDGTMSDSTMTVLRVANWDSATSTIQSDAGSETNALPNSYYLPGKPAWFNSLAWPPVGGYLSPMASPIPAQLRYLGIQYADNARSSSGGQIARGGKVSR